MRTYPPITSHKFPNFFVLYLDFATKEVRKRNLIRKYQGQKKFRGQHVARERRVERALIYNNIPEITGGISIFRLEAGLQNGIPTETSHMRNRVDNLHAEKESELDSPLQEFLENQYVKVVMLSAISASRLYSQKISLVLSVTGWVDSRATLQPEELCQ
jgi:hypothetical protein